MNDEILKLALKQRHCECGACVTLHASDCAVHNEPAYPNGPCDCGVDEAFYNAAFNAGIEAAAKVCSETTNEAFMTTLWTLENSIRALEKK